MPLINILARLTRRLGASAYTAAQMALFPFVLLRSELDRRPTIRSISPLRSSALGSKVAVFCHFDRAGHMREDLRHYLNELSRAGFALIVVSNSPSLQPSARNFLEKCTVGIVLRRNVGFDFAAWKDALAAYDLPRPETTLLLLANDSLYGPLRPLGPVLAAADFSLADLWALTDSWQLHYHLQSYFLLAGPAVLRSRAWSRFWSQVRPLASKYWVIRRYEIRFSQMMLRAGNRLGAIWPYRHLLESSMSESRLPAGENDPLLVARQRQQRRILEAMVRGQPLNPTSDLWRALLVQGFPFLKRELLRDNPTRVADLWEWQMHLGAESEIDATVILADLALSARNRAP